MIAPSAVPSAALLAVQLAQLVALAIALVTAWLYKLGLMTLSRAGQLLPLAIALLVATEAFAPQPGALLARARYGLARRTTSKSPFRRTALTSATDVAVAAATASLALLLGGTRAAPRKPA